MNFFRKYFSRTAVQALELFFFLICQVQVSSFYLFFLVIKNTYNWLLYLKFKSLQTRPGFIYLGPKIPNFEPTRNGLFCYNHTLSVSILLFFNFFFFWTLKNHHWINFSLVQRWFQFFLFGILAHNVVGSKLYNFGTNLAKQGLFCIFFKLSCRSQFQLFLIATKSMWKLTTCIWQI